MSTYLNYKSLFDPYETTYGKMVNISGVRTQLSKLMLTGDDRTYGLDFGYDIEAVIITGKSKEEEDISPFELPVISKTGSGKYIIGIDLREYVNNSIKSKDILTYDDLLSCMPRHDGPKILFRMASVMSALLSGDLGKLPKDDFMACYTCLFTTVINSIVRLEPNDELGCKVILALWSYLLASDVDFNDIDIVMITRMIVNKMRLSSTTKTNDWIKDLVFRLSLAINNLAVEEVKTVNGLCKVMSSVYSPDIAKFFNASVFSNQLKNSWFGPGKQLAAISSLECIPVFVGITEGALGITTFKSSRLTQMLNKHGRIINSNEYVKRMERNFPYRSH